MRWTKSDGFYLERLKVVECETPEEVLACFEEGVKHKVIKCRASKRASSTR
jgi:hypothetical protein